MMKKAYTTKKIFVTVILLFCVCILDAVLFLFYSGSAPACILLLLIVVLEGLLFIWLIRPFVRAVKKVYREGLAGDLQRAGMPEDILEAVLCGRWADIAADYKNMLEKDYNNREVTSQIKFSILQHQINPHFLYNTLDSVRGLAYMEGADSAAEMAGALAAFFRYSISNSDDIVTLSKELDNIKRYFVIQKYRFSNRFSLNIRIAEDDMQILGYPIPKLILQPLVENALFHGLEHRAGKGNVTISAQNTGNRLYLYITDDGVGMSEQKVREINKAIYEETPPDQGENGRGTGIAFYNINKRIRYLYGEEYGLSVESTAGKGTQVEIVLPWVLPEEVN